MAEPLLPLHDGVALWLLPEPQAAARLAALMERINAPRDAAPFAPHLTLASHVGGLAAGAATGLLADDRARDAAVSLVAVHHGPIALAWRDLARTSRFTQALMLRFLAPAELLRMRETAYRALDVAPEHETPFAPHLSLAYGVSDLPEEEAMAADLAALPREIIFDQIGWMSFRSPVENQADVADWRIGATEPLADE